MRVVNQQVPTPFHDIDVGTLLRPNVLEFARKGAAAAAARRAAARAARRRSSAQVSAMDVVLGLAEALPVGPLLRRRASSATCARCSPTPTAPTTSALLEPELYLAATDLDTCERIVFGADGWDDVPISHRRARLDGAADGLQAGRASSDRELVDGGIVSTTNLDIAVEAGAKLVVVVNPLVPVRQRLRRAIPTLFGSRVRARQRHGLPADRLPDVQAAGLPAPARDGARSWEERYPGVDIVLIEPEPDDELMFQTSIMNFTSRVEIARHGFQSVTLKLAEDYDALQARSASATASRSPPRACARSSSTSRAEKEQTARLAQDPRADDRRAAAPVGSATDAARG